jgi:hypothetical protein
MTRPTRRPLSGCSATLRPTPTGSTPSEAKRTEPGKHYRRTDRRDEAVDHFIAATTMHREMGMTYWLEKAEAEIQEIR